jgi:hypothetical protein
MIKMKKKEPKRRWMNEKISNANGGQQTMKKMDWNKAMDQEI